jgi:hypothetical protein
VGAPRSTVAALAHVAEGAGLSGRTSPRKRFLGHLLGTHKAGSIQARSEQAAGEGVKERRRSTILQLLTDAAKRR